MFFKRNVFGGVNLVSRYVKRFIFAILFLVFYFVIFINFAPQILSFIESFVTANSDMFRFNVKLKEFSVVNNTVVSEDKYVSIDLSMLLVFIANFFFYVVIPFGTIFVLWGGRK